MSDPDTVAIPVLAGAALTQGISFLYGQAAEALRTRRESRPAPRITLMLPAAFEPQAAAVSPDLAVLDARAAELRVLLRDAETFTNRPAADLDGGDRALRLCFGRIRDVLERVYGTRLAFVGERRGAPSVRQDFVDVHGSATGMNIRGTGPGIGGSVVQRAETVHRGGDVTGISFEVPS